MNSFNSGFFNKLKINIYLKHSHKLICIIPNMYIKTKKDFINTNSETNFHKTKLLEIFLLVISQ